MNNNEFGGNPALGVVALIVLGPVCVIAGGVAAAALLAAVFGVEIGFLQDSTSFDFLYGTDSGAMVQYFTFMVGAVVASLTGGTIMWAFTGKFPTSDS